MNDSFSKKPSLEDKSKLAEQIKELFADVTPLHNPQKIPRKKPVSTRPQLIKKAAESFDTHHSHYEAVDDTWIEWVTPDSKLFYAAASLAPKQLQDLKKGLFAIQAKLDLHRLNTHEAQQAFEQFIHQAREKNLRYLLIVHGKAYRNGPHATLKSYTQHWLKRTTSVLAFCSAQPQHGGTGALYVWLKK